MVSMSIILTLGKWRQEDQDFKARLVYREFEANLGYRRGKAKPIVAKSVFISCGCAYGSRKDKCVVFLGNSCSGRTKGQWSKESWVIPKTPMCTRLGNVLEARAKKWVILNS